MPLAPEPLAPKLLPEITHDLLLREEERFGRQIKSYEFGPQDLIFPDREYLIEADRNLAPNNLIGATETPHSMMKTSQLHQCNFISDAFDTKREKLKKIQYWQHPLYELLEKNVEEFPLHSNWLAES